MFHSAKKEMNAITESKHGYVKGFIPFAIAGAVLSLCGGFTASVPSTIATLWNRGGDVTTWITLAYAVSFVGMAPIMGKLSDLFGRRTAILIGTGVFGIGELLIGICPLDNIPLLLIFRFIAGCGGAAIAPPLVGYIMTEFPPEKTGKGFSFYMFLSTAMVIFGPTVGGIIIDKIGWRPVMYICFVLCLIGFLCCFIMIKKKKEGEAKKAFAGFDGPGAVFVLLFFALFMCIPTFGQSYGWISFSTVICFGAAVIAFIFLILIERRAEKPILNGKFMARRQFILPVIILFLTQGLMQSCTTNTILFVLATQHTTTLSGIATSLLYLGMAIGAIGIGPIADKKEPKLVAAAALIFTAAGAALQLMFKADTGIVIFGLSLLLIGLGLGGNASTFLKVTLSGISPELSGVGSGTYTMFSNMAGPFGVAVFVPMFATGREHAIANGIDVARANVGSIRSTALVQIACVIVGIAVCFLIPRIYGTRRDKKQQGQAAQTGM